VLPAAGRNRYHRSIMRTSHLLIGVLALALAGAAAFAWLAPSGPDRAPELALTTLQGQQLRFTELRGRPVVVTFWSISCPSCIQDIAKLTALHEALAGRGLEIIAIAMPYDPPSHVLAVSRGRQIPYPVALDIRGEAARAFGDVRLTPTTFVIAPDGRVREVHTGALDVERVHTLVLSLLPGKDTLDTQSAGG
jgi:peroxiredoxin